MKLCRYNALLHSLTSLNAVVHNVCVSGVVYETKNELNLRSVTVGVRKTCVCE